MKVIIVGAGKIGLTIIKSLISEKHEVTVIDNNSEVVEKLNNSYDIIAICGNGTSYNVLNDAKISKADLLIACTSLDELNMLVCYLGRKLGAKNTIARIRSVEQNEESVKFISTQLELSLSINPELSTAKDLCNILKLPSAIKVETFSSAQLEMYEISIKSNLQITEIPLIELRKKFQLDFLVCLIERNGKVFIPNGYDVLKDGDKIGVISPKEDTTKLLKYMNMLEKQAKNVIIVGASKTAYYLCKLLEKSNINVKVIDKNESRCEEIRRVLSNNATVIFGDGMSQDLLNEEGISSCDCFISLTNKDEQNILMSLYATNKKVKTVITKINREELWDVAKSLGLERIISPKQQVADIVVKYARSLDNLDGCNIEMLFSLMDGKAEALEFRVSSNFKKVNIPIKDLKIKAGILIAGIIRNKEVIIPTGNDVILLDDEVVVITSSKKLYDLTEIL